MASGFRCVLVVFVGLSVRIKTNPSEYISKAVFHSAIPHLIACSVVGITITAARYQSKANTVGYVDKLAHE